MNQHRSTWTPDRDAQLRAFWDAGHTGTKIARLMGATKNSIIGRVHRLGFPKRAIPAALTVARLWAPEDDARLRQLYGGFLNAAQIAERMDRTPSAIKYRATVLGLTFKKASPPRGAVVSGARVRTSRSKRAAKTSAAPPSARGGRASFPPPAPDLPGVAPDTLMQRRVFLGRECKFPLWDDDRPATYLFGGRRFCEEPVIENAKGCASPYCLQHYATAYIGTNKDLGEPNKLRWRP